MTQRRILWIFLLWCIWLTPRFAGAGGPAQAGFEISYPASLSSGPITGRVFVAISRRNQPEPRLQAGYYGPSAPLFGIYVEQMKPGETVTIDSSTLGFPLMSSSDLPAGDCHVQAILNIHTQFRRKDGHVIWAHMDRWEGQQWNRSPGNLVSNVQRLPLNPSVGFRVKLGVVSENSVQLETDALAGFG